ncbi:MAG: hypothetical protein QM687_09780 [Ferruginibacter sp.]
MKSILNSFAVGLLLLSASCNFSKGVKKDLGTGLSASYNGFAIEDIYLTADDQKLSNNSISLGNKVDIVATGVHNYKVKDGRVYPACTIILKDKSGKELLSLPDAFSDRTNGFGENEASTLSATINTGDPMVAGETYHFSAKFYDKLQPASVIDANVDIVVKK